MPDEWDRLVDVVGEAALLEPDASRAYLQDALRDEPELLAEAQRILAAGTEDDVFLRHPPPAAAASAALVAGSEVGPYRLLRILGQGGMGTVFLARQEHPDRVVALKILRGALLSPMATRRIEYEVQALAALRHPGIAQVFEAGVHVHDDGVLRHERPWFAMEYVEDGATLLAYVDRAGLTRKERLSLFLEICDAVQHAHQKGVVHRDLKPENILVSGGGHPKVIDFGVAKSTDKEAPLTTLGAGGSQIIGTLPYLSPERVTGGRAAADVRTDVYALGVVLFQLLTGRLPIEVDPGDIVTAAQRICREPPRRPSRIDRTISTDLDAVLLKALAKDAEDRYASVAGLAADVARFLDDLPVQARPPTVAHQLRLFARRNRALVAASAAVLAILIVGAAVSLRFALESRRSERTAIAERQRAEDVVQVVLRRNVENTLRLAPAVNELAGGKKHVEVLMRSVADDLAELDRLAEEDPRVRVLLARTYIRLGDTQGNEVHPNLGKPDEARASYLRALEIAQTAGLGRDAKLAAIEAQLSLGELLLQEGHRRHRRGKDASSLREEQEQRLTAGLEQAKALLTRYPGDPRVARMLATLHNRLGHMRLDAGDAEATHRHADAIQALDPDGQLLIERLSHELLARMHSRAGHWPEAVTSLRYLADVAEREASAPEATFRKRRRLVYVLSQLGLAAGRAESFETAVASYERMIAVQRTVLAEDPDAGPREGQNLAIALYDLGALCVAVSSTTDDEARRRDLLEKALAAYEESRERMAPLDAPGGHTEHLSATLDAEVARLRSLLAASEDR